MWRIVDGSRRAICWGRGGEVWRLTAVEEPFAGRGEERCGESLTAVEEPFAGGGEEKGGGEEPLEEFLAGEEQGEKVSASGGETEGEVHGCILIYGKLYTSCFSHRPCIVYVY